MFTLQIQTLYTVILENWEGKCKRVKIIAWTADEAMAKADATRPGWTAVGVDYI